MRIFRRKSGRLDLLRPSSADAFAVQKEKLTGLKVGAGALRLTGLILL